MADINPLVLIEDNDSDIQNIQYALQAIGYKRPLQLFAVTAEALEYLHKTNINTFLIICDLHIGFKDAIHFKKVINASPKLHLHSIPFLYYYHTAAQEFINNLYLNMGVQGIFKKSADSAEMMHIIYTILNYWEMCDQPLK